MTPQQPGQPRPDPNRTIRHRWPQPGPPPDEQGPPEYHGTRRLPYTPDMLPDVPQYEAKPPKSGWWWVILVGGIAVLIAAAAVVAILVVRNTQSTPAKPTPEPASQGTSPPVSQPVGAPRVTDVRAGVSYLVPDGWARTAPQPYTSGIAKDGAIVVAYPGQGGDDGGVGGDGGAQSVEQLQATAGAEALRTARHFMPDLASRDDVRGGALRIGDRDAATASFRGVFRSPSKDPAYVRLVAVRTGDAVSFVYGSAMPGDEAARQALDTILDSVTLS
jgi:hypothetical protein